MIIIFYEEVGTNMFLRDDYHEVYAILKKKTEIVKNEHAQTLLMLGKNVIKKGKIVCIFMESRQTIYYKLLKNSLEYPTYKTNNTIFLVEENNMLIPYLVLYYDCTPSLFYFCPTKTAKTIIYYSTPITLDTPYYLALEHPIIQKIKEKIEEKRKEAEEEVYYLIKREYEKRREIEKRFEKRLLESVLLSISVYMMQKNVRHCSFNIFNKIYHAYYTCKKFPLATDKFFRKLEEEALKFIKNLPQKRKPHTYIFLWQNIREIVEKKDGLYWIINKTIHNKKIITNFFIFFPKEKPISFSSFTTFVNTYLTPEFEKRGYAIPNPYQIDLSYENMKKVLLSYRAENPEIF